MAAFTVCSHLKHLYQLQNEVLAAYWRKAHTHAYGGIDDTNGHKIPEKGFQKRKYFRLIQSKIKVQFVFKDHDFRLLWRALHRTGN